MKKSGPNPKRTLERLRSNEAVGALAQDLGVRDADVVMAREIVRHIGEHQADSVGRLPDPLAQALVEAAVQIEHVGFLQAVAEGGAKNAASFARRGLSILKSRGIDIEVPLTGTPVFKAEAKGDESLPWLITSTDTQGERALWIVRPQRGGGLQAIISILSDTVGIRRVDEGELSRKEYRSLRERLTGAAPKAPSEQELGLSAQELPLSRAKGFLARARERTAGGLHLREDRILTGLFGDPAEAEPASKKAPELPGELENQRLVESARLHDEREIVSWMPDEAACRHLSLKLEEVMTSALYIDQPQRLAQFEREVAAAAESWFTPERAALYTERLFDMADLFAATGRREAAERAAATARALARGRNPLGVPFCTSLFSKLFPTPKGAEAAEPQAESTSEGGIILPGSSAP